MAAEDASLSVMAMTAQGSEDCQRAYLPQEARLAAAAARDVAVQAVVGNVGAAALEKRRLDPAAAPVEVPARMVSPPLQARNSNRQCYVLRCGAARSDIVALLPCCVAHSHWAFEKSPKVSTETFQRPAWLWAQHAHGSHIASF